MSAGSSLVRGAAVAAGLICALFATLSPRVAKGAWTDETTDEVRLRDGRRVRGRIVERAPGQWVVVETEDGRRRTFAWDTVEEVDVAAAPRPAIMEDAAREAWRKRSGFGATYEIRANFSTMTLAEQRFALRGFCSTGTGTTDATIYGQSAEDGALGFGGGVGGRVGFMFRSRLDPEGASSWWGLRFALGLDLNTYHLRSPTGLASARGELCSEVARKTHELSYGSSVQPLIHVPLNLGAHVAIGKLDDSKWKGIVLGAAWSPSFMHVGAFSSIAQGHLNPLGLELTFDFVVIHAVPAGQPEPQLRISLFFAPHTRADLPAVGTFSVGAAWY